MAHCGSGGKPFPHSCLEEPSPNKGKRQKCMTLKDELPKVVGAQYATGQDRENQSPEGMKRMSQSRTKPNWGM